MIPPPLCRKWPLEWKYGYFILSIIRSLGPLKFQSVIETMNHTLCNGSWNCHLSTEYGQSELDRHCGVD